VRKNPLKGFMKNYHLLVLGILIFVGLIIGECLGNRPSEFVAMTLMGGYTGRRSVKNGKTRNETRIVATILSMQ